MKTIETKIAKNGVQMYFRVDENGKKRRIKADAQTAFEYAMQYTAQREHDDAMSEANTTAETIDAAVEVDADETADYDDKRFSISISYKIQEADGQLLKNEYARFATAADAANHIIAFVAAHPDYIYQDGVIADWNTKTTKYDLTSDDMLVAAEKIADNTVTFNPTDTPKPFSGKLFSYDVCEYHSVEEYISELKITQSAVIMENLFKNDNGSFSYDGWGRKTYYMTDCYREAYYGGGITDEIKFDAESTAQLIYAETQLKNIVNGSDGSEEDSDDDNVFDLLPALDELNDVNIDDDDDNTPPVKKSFELTVNNERVFFIDGKFDSVFSYTYDAGFATEYSKYYYFERINQKHGCISIMKLIDDEEEFFALMVERGACTIDGDNPDNEPDDKQAKKELASAITAYLNERNKKRLQAGFKPIIPYASRDAHYHKLHGAAKWTVAYDSVNDTFGIWSEYGWHESGFSLGYEFCGWYKIAKLAVIIIRLTTAIDYAQSEFYFELDDTLSNRPRRSYSKWQAVRATHLKDKINRDTQAAEKIAAG